MLAATPVSAVQTACFAQRVSGMHTLTALVRDLGERPLLATLFSTSKPSAVQLSLRP